jgi:hypothetical protein
LWQKLLLVLGILLVGCSRGGENFPIQILQGAISTAHPEPDKSKTLNSPSQIVVESQSSNSLPNLGQAAEWTNDVWLNTDRPLYLSDIKGKVILLEMWTFG